MTFPTEGSWRRRRPGAQRGRPGGETLASVDRLEGLVEEATRMPLSDHVIVKAQALRELAAQLAATLTDRIHPVTEKAMPLLARSNELDGLAAEARQIPLTGLVSVRRLAVYEICDSIRADLAADGATPPPELFGAASDPPLDEAEEWVRLWAAGAFASGVTAIAGGIALGAFLDPYLYAIALIGALYMIAFAVVRSRLVRGHSDLREGRAGDSGGRAVKGGP